MVHRAATILFAAFATALPARADDVAEPLVAALSCTPVGEAGQRVRCEVEMRSDSFTIRWADVELASVPDHVAPLKGRIGPHDASLREASMWRFSFALVGKRPGTGPVTAHIRAVVCTEGRGVETCRPVMLETKGLVRVGP